MRSPALHVLTDEDYLASVADVIDNMRPFAEIKTLAKGCPDPERYAMTLLESTLRDLDYSYRFFAPQEGQSMKHDKAKVLTAIDEFNEQVEVVAHQTGKHAPDDAAAGLFSNFDPQKFLNNLHIILGAAGPFIPAPVGPILTAIDGVLSKINAGGDTAASDESEE